MLDCNLIFALTSLNFGKFPGILINILLHALNFLTHKNWKIDKIEKAEGIFHQIPPIFHLFLFLYCGGGSGDFWLFGF